MRACSTLQGCSHQIWSSQVRSVCTSACKNFFKFRGYEIASESILDQYNPSRRPDDPLCSLHHTTLFQLSNSLFISRKPHPLQIRFARFIFHLEERKLKSCFALFAAISPVATCHLCALCGHPLSNGGNWRGLASHKRGTSGLV